MGTEFSEISRQTITGSAKSVFGLASERNRWRFVPFLHVWGNTNLLSQGKLKVSITHNTLL